MKKLFLILLVTFASTVISAVNRQNPTIDSCPDWAWKPGKMCSWSVMERHKP